MRKLCFLIFSFMVLFFSLRGWGSKSESGCEKKGVTVNMYNNNNNNTSVYNTMLLYQEITKVVKENTGRLHSFLYENRYRAMIAMVAVVYGYLFVQVIKGNHYLARTDLWAGWKREAALTELLSLSQDLLSKELLIEIQRRCTRQENPADFIGSLVLFLRQIEDEINHVSYLMKLHGTLCKIRFALLFPFNKKQFLHISDRMNRLIYIRTTFLNWAANYKIEQNSIRLVLEE